MNIGRVVEIFETLLTLKQGDLSLQAHFSRLQALIQELYADIYLSGICPSIASQLRGSLLSSDHVPGLTTNFSAALRVMTSMPSLPLSFAQGDTPSPLVMAISAPRAHNDGGLPPRFDGSPPPCGRGRNIFLPCPHCGKKNHLANQCWKQFGKPPIAQVALTPLATFSPAPPNILAPQYHVTLTSAEYDTLRRFASIDAYSFSSLVSFLAPSTSGTSALLASSSPSWIIDSGSSSHMTGTSSLLSSYHPTPSHSPVTIADGRPCLVQGCGTTPVTLLFLYTKYSMFLVSLSTFSLLVLSLVLFSVQLPSFPFIVFSRICTPDRGMVWVVRTAMKSMSSLLMNPHRAFKLFLLHLLLLPPFCGIAV